MALEIFEYDVLGRQTLLVKYRRRPVFVADPSLPVPKREDGSPSVAVDEHGVATRMAAPAGPVVETRIALSELLPSEAQALLDAFEAIESVVQTITEDHVAAIVASPGGIDAKIADANRAVLAAMQQVADARASAEMALLVKAQAERETAEHMAEQEKARAEIAALRAEIAAAAAAPPRDELAQTAEHEAAS